LLTSLRLVATATHLERRLFFVEVDALLIILGHVSVIVLLHRRGIAG
jgi:hypothetical protein